MQFNCIALLVFLFSVNLHAKIEAVIGPVPLTENLNIAVMPEMKSEDEIIISRRQYLISYNKLTRLPNWVSWKLEASDIGDAERTNFFMSDVDLEDYLKKHGNGSTVVRTSEFTGTCFNRGHQVPSKDRTDTKKNNEETFLTSNIIPQTSYLNQVTWSKLEDHSRRLIQQGKKLYIIAGPIYDEDFGTIGPRNDIPVPSKNFKVVFILDQNQTPADINNKTETIAVIMPNVLSDGSKPVNGKACETNRGFNQATIAKESWEKYRVTVKQLQKASGIDFTEVFH